MAQSDSMLLKFHYIYYENKLGQSYSTIILNLKVVLILTDMRSCFNELESNDKEKVEEFKFKLREQFNCTKDSWILNGMYDYYMSTGSSRALDVLVTIREPHDKYLFDRLNEGMKSKDKLPALLLLGHIVRRQPIWLYKIANHPVIKELLRLLKNETDTVILVSALLVLNILLPLIPAFIGPYLQDICEIFSRFAAWNTNNPNKLPDGHLVHLQIASYMLFHRLYGMFPCHFLSYLRQEYSLVDNLPIFTHTIKPMLSTVRLNPLLVTTTKEFEKSTDRWKKLQQHDIIVQCAKLLTSGSFYHRSTASDVPETPLSSVNFDDLYKALKTNNDNTVANRCSELNSTSQPTQFWSPTFCFRKDRISSAPTSIPQTPNLQSMVSNSPYFDQPGISPPETGIEATPETTPIRMELDYPLPPPEIACSAKRTLSSYLNDGNSSVTSSMQKDQYSPNYLRETSPFRFPLNLNAAQNRKIDMMVRERNQMNELSNKEKRCDLRNNSPTTPPTLLSMISDNNSSSSLETVQFQNLEDKEVQDLLSKKNKSRSIGIEGSGNRYCCDSVLQEFPIPTNEFECCEQEQVGSPCSSGGLHMPDTRSVIEFATQMHRLRCNSHCVSGSASTQTLYDLSINCSPSSSKNKYFTNKMRRTKSCPNINRNYEKLSDSLSLKSSKLKLHQPNGTTLTSEKYKFKNGLSKLQINNSESFREVDEKTETNSIATQTDDSMPACQYPYEHLFLSLFPQLADPCDEPSTRNGINCFSLSNDKEQEKFWCQMYSPASLLQRYIDTVIKCELKEPVTKFKQPYKGSTHAADKSDKRNTNDQLTLFSILLQFEEYRREVHAERNRRLLGRSRDNKALEEHNSALRDQIGLLQKELENSSVEMKNFRLKSKIETDRLEATTTYWKNCYTELENNNRELRNKCLRLEQELKDEQRKSDASTKSLYETETTLLNTSNELKCTRQEAEACNIYKSQVEFLQREVLKAGEVIIRCKNMISEMKRVNSSNMEFEMCKQVYTKHMHQLQGNLYTKLIDLKALKSCCSSLQAELEKKTCLIEEQKLKIDQLNEKYNVDMKERRESYENLKLSYNRQLKDVNDLQHKLIIARAVQRQAFQPKLPPDGNPIRLPQDRSEIGSPINNSSNSVSASTTQDAHYGNLQQFQQQHRAENSDQETVERLKKWLETDITKSFDSD